MQVTCAKGHTQEISDPSDDGWEYTATERFEPTTVTLPDGSQTQIQHRVPVPTSRRLVWKCSAPAPTADNEKALCGSVEVIEESIVPATEGGTDE